MSTKDFGRHIKYMFSIFVKNFSSIDDDHKKLSLSKETNLKTKAETLDTWISLNKYPNDMKFLTYTVMYDL
jgi:hypothetical protein